MQKTQIAPTPAARKPHEQIPREEAQSTGLLDKLEAATQQDDPWVYACYTRLCHGGCRRTFPEHDPPDCPIYTTDTPSPLFKGAVRVKLSALKARLNEKGLLNPGQTPTNFVPYVGGVEKVDGVSIYGYVKEDWKP